MGLPGQAGGEAVRNLLYGTANPCGKLAESWPVRYEDCPSAKYYGTRDAVYREGIYVGYRHYDKAGVIPRWRFGYGLSYTRFEYSGAKIDGQTISVTVANTGDRAGAEIVQLYISPQDAANRPVRELKRFAKTYLEPGESKTVSFQLEESCFAVWSAGWRVIKDVYTVWVGGNPDGLLRAGAIEPAGEEIILSAPWETLEHTPYIPTKGRYTMYDSVIDMKTDSVVMKLVYWGTKRTISRGAKPGTPEYRMMLEASAGSPLRSMYISSGMKSSLFEGLLLMANGRFFKGLRVLLSK